MHPLYAQIRSSLLGRLKTIELTSISGSIDKVPPQRILIAAIMDRWRRNAEDGRFLFHLIYGYHSQRVDVPTTMSVRHIDLVLTTLGQYKPIMRLFAEEGLAEADDPFGVLLLGHERPDGQPGYYATVHRKSTYPNVAFVSLVPNGKRQARIQVINSDGYKTISLKEATKSFEIRLIVAAIWNNLTSQRPKSIPVENLVVDPNTEPPLDREFMNRIVPAIKGELPVSIVRTSSDDVLPFDLDFCLRIETEVVKQFVSLVDADHPIPLVVYWNGSNFIMSDDYHAFAAYRMSNTAEMRLAVLGEFPEEHVLLEKRGGAELLPPLIVTSKEVTDTTPEYKRWRFDQRLRQRARADVPADLAATWLVLADMLGSDKTTERELHNFLLKYPVAISAYATSVESEIWLGNQFRMDLLVRSSGVREEVTLIELEHHRHPIFTSDGRPHHKVTHSCQQVRDWLQWLGEHPNAPLAIALAGIKPRGIVIMGRSASFSEKERRLLANFNETSLVQVITYDEVLDRFRDLILSRCDAEN